MTKRIGKASSLSIYCCTEHVPYIAGRNLIGSEFELLSQKMCWLVPITKGGSVFDFSRTPRCRGTGRI